MLALIHHMLVSERIPLPEIISLAAELTNNLLVIEFISPDDSMFRLLTRGRDDLFVHLTPEHFEAICRRQRLVRQAEVKAGNFGSVLFDNLPHRLIEWGSIDGRG